MRVGHPIVGALGDLHDAFCEKKEVNGNDE